MSQQAVSMSAMLSPNPPLRHYIRPTEQLGITREHRPATPDFQLTSQALKQLASVTQSGDKAASTAAYRIE